MTDRAKSTSYSRASLYEKCPLQFKLRYLDKVPSPAPALPEGEEYPMDRGTRLHTLAENYVQNPMLRIPPEIASLERRLNALRVLYERGQVELEKPLAFDENWQPSAGDDFVNTRYRMVADVWAMITPERLMLVDHKSGKKKGNEIKHHEQLMEYAICASIIDTSIQIFEMQNWYFDLPEGENVMAKTFTRTQVIAAFNKMRERHQKVLNARIFPAAPSQFACRFCDYKAGMVGRGKKAYPGTGHCRRNIC